jgi:hypothetical protein
MRPAARHYAVVNRRIQFVLPLLLCATLKVAAQGTAFNYQGRLTDTGAPANAAYDFRFTIFNAVTNGSPISLPLTNSAVAVSNGLFNVTLDFGPGIFTGTNCWLDIAVRAAGNNNFTALFPRQPLLPVPYAIFATGASNLLGQLPATQLAGTIPSAQISGTYSGQVNFANGANNFSGTFSGNGSSLANLNGTQVTSGTVADARLSGNVALLNGNQTYTGNNQFNGANNFTNFGNDFSGSFFGNGLVGWVTVPGMAQQAVKDHGYMLTSPGFATLTLPLSSGLSGGDIVRVSGAGTGGWLIAENSGQAIFGNFASYRNGYLLALPNATLPSGSDCRGVAASADGVTMYAVGNFTGIYGSANAGQTWSRVGMLAGSWFSIACSANGKIVYAAPSNAGIIQVSTNSGLTWAATASSGASVACTADGSKFFTGNIACSGNGNYLAKISAGIAVSTNAGSTWFNIPAPFGTPTGLAASSDCTRLVAGVGSGLLYASSNLGASWTTLTTTNQLWSGAWMSADGSKFAASFGKSGSVDGGLFSSTITPQPNTISTNSTISGSQGTAVELQYIGNNQFMPVSAIGLLWAN